MNNRIARTEEIQHEPEEIMEDFSLMRTGGVGFGGEYPRRPIKIYEKEKEQVG